MSKGRSGEFTDVLVKKGVIGKDQLTEAQAVQRSTGAKMADTLVKLGYCTAQDVIEAMAEFHGLQFVDLAAMTIPPSVVELVPESVARENVILPMAADNGALRVAMSDPMDLDTIQKLTFILNKDIQPVLAPREQIIESINRYYGQSETESVDSMLAEFTDTAIDTTETEAVARQVELDQSDAPVVRLVNLMIQEAIALRASDIHV